MLSTSKIAPYFAGYFTVTAFAASFFLRVAFSTALTLNLYFAYIFNNNLHTVVYLVWLYAMPKNNNKILLLFSCCCWHNICINRKIRLFVLAFGFSLTRVRCVAIQ